MCRHFRDAGTFQLILEHRTLIHVVASAEWDGPGRYAFDICNYFNRQGWKVKALTRDAKAVDRPFQEEGIEIRHAPLRDYPDIYSARALVRQFRRIPKGQGIVHVHRYNDALTCIIARRLSGRSDIRLVATRHKAEVGRDSFLRRIIYKGIDSHLFVSDFSKRMFLEGWAPGKCPLSEEKTSIAYNSLFHPVEELLPEPSQGPIVAVYRGGLKKGKGLETLIEAFSMVNQKKLRLKIVGRGHPDYVDSLRSLSQKLGVTEKIDWIRGSVLPPHVLRESHFGVFPSAAPEAFGMANLELMACGRPQISTFEGAQGEFLHPGVDALSVPPDNPEALAEAIRTLASNPALRKKMGESSYNNYISNFSWQRFLERLMPCYLPEK